MPTWSKEELEAVNPNTESWSEEFDIYGGVPRLVLFSDSESSSPMEAALEQKGFFIAERFLKAGLASIDLLQNYLLVHINPPTLTDGSFMYHGKEEYSLASSYVYDVLKGKHINQMIVEACNVFNAGLGPKTYGDSDSGKMFEKLCLYLRPITGSKFNATSLSTGAPSMSFSIPKETFLLKPDWEKLKQLPIDKLILPYKSNFESADAFYVVEDSPNSFQLVILQITVAEETHSVKVNGLVRIINGFPEPVRENISGLKIVFITPAEGLCLSEEQNLTTSERKKNSTEIIPDVVKDSQQFLFKYRVGV